MSIDRHVIRLDVQGSQRCVNSFPNVHIGQDAKKKVDAKNATHRIKKKTRFDKERIRDGSDNRHGQGGQSCRVYSMGLRSE